MAQQTLFCECLSVLNGVLVSSRLPSPMYCGRCLRPRDPRIRDFPDIRAIALRKEARLGQDARPFKLQTSNTGARAAGSQPRKLKIHILPSELLPHILIRLQTGCLDALIDHIHTSHVPMANGLKMFASVASVMRMTSRESQ